jgi:heme-degrading monooxygenase HmoA
VVIAVFRSRLREGVSEEFQVLGDEMTRLAKAMPGFISYKVYVSPDGERCSIIEFESNATLENWRQHPEHLEAQKTGRDRFYQWYTLHVSEPTRESRFGR